MNAIKMFKEIELFKKWKGVINDDKPSEYKHVYHNISKYVGETCHCKTQRCRLRKKIRDYLNNDCLKDRTRLDEILIDVCVGYDSTLITTVTDYEQLKKDYEKAQLKIKSLKKKLKYTE